MQSHIEMEIYHELADKLSPNAEVTKRPNEQKYRVWLPINVSDGFIIDFSGEVADGFRIGYVIDLDQQNSSRRKEFSEKVKEIHKKRNLEDLFDAPLINRQKNETILRDGRMKWIKNSIHRRMGFHKYIRINNFRDLSSEEVVGLMEKSSRSFIETTMRELL
ncbi:hypothetical protein [Bacillus sp. Marseille-P3661]|uniref:hypothetical protein n=1 Tax=Bacillus sp. Marseille-P3661 TaxID=1936234 RepID=UPI000C85E921|nr:hypothetical protein [Bacillus sp. Marseille-P3661]